MVLGRSRSRLSGHVCECWQLHAYRIQNAALELMLDGSIILLCKYNKQVVKMRLVQLEILQKDYHQCTVSHISVILRESIELGSNNNESNLLMCLFFSGSSAVALSGVLGAFLARFDEFVYAATCGFSFLFFQVVFFPL